MARTEASRPLRIAVEHRVVCPERTFFDYGCGRGGDVAWLKRLGWRARGWDPVHRPSARRVVSDTVALTYVLNVIESENERRRALEMAWQLTKIVMIVSARLHEERDESHSRPRSDGWMTARGTFQKFFEHLELGGFIQNATGVEPVPAAPGVYYVFKNALEREAFVSRRYALRAPAPYQRKSDQDFVENRELLDELIEFFARHGRLPRESEISNAAALIAKFGSLARAFRVVEVVTDRDEWIALSGRRRVDLLVYLSLRLLDGPYRMSDLAPASQLDVRAHFGSLKAAMGSARRLLYGVGDSRNIDLACKSSSVGKLTPTALYVHVDAYEHLPAILKVYEGCARRLFGEIDGAALIKLYRAEKKVSYLAYPTFDTDPHPALRRSNLVDLMDLRLVTRTYSDGSASPILHRKETFLHKSDRRWVVFDALTRQEEQAGLLGTGEPIGLRHQWNALLARKGWAVRAHELVPEVPRC